MRTHRGGLKKTGWSPEPIFAAGGLLAIGFLYVCIVHRNIVSRAVTRPHPNQSAQIVRAESQAPLLEIESTIQHGDIYEIKGSAEPGSSVMINGEHAPMLSENSSFDYFIGPLPEGGTIVTVTAQTQFGGVSTRQVALTVP